MTNKKDCAYCAEAIANDTFRFIPAHDSYVEGHGTHCSCSRCF